MSTGSADIIRHPGVADLRNARNRARWLERYYSGVHCADLRTPELYRRGEWIALQAAWLRRGYRLLARPEPTERPGRAEQKLFFERERKA